MIDQRHHAQISHLHRVLLDQALHIFSPERLDRLRACIETDQLHIASTSPNISQRQDYPDCRRLAWGEHSIDFPAITAKQILRGLVAGFACRSGVLVAGKKFDLWKPLLQHVQKSRLSFLSACRTDSVAQQDDLAFAPQQFAQVLCGKLASFEIICGHEADVVVGLEARIHNDDGDFGAHRCGDRPNQRF